MREAADEAFMRRAIALARAAAGTTAPNPPAGCVTVARGRIVGEEATTTGGRTHAEALALAAA
ncbi:MAG: bifunctional diaminohydroxyphosphoribosylaminopyrimidine deaminase/5-amino-6-(5-phosphoribosylamino)uracil reductase RibD, partial [Caulobacteraceae bacterium]